ncbi:LADA_0E09802g1_1 [Lachancea dasiensis]|uniref:Regulator of rDNA transcription 14 n=1 Tax=Lachancea dasiensis TaxID=1072105 RepID=A0A1G4JE52_9SACH|nr:LADA_0E09802g1_1 [Lachancea dasiensis]
MSSTASREQATAAVNSVLSWMLPGSPRVDDNTRSSLKNRSKKGSKAQLINQNLKKAVRVRERDAQGIKKREMKARKKQIRAKQVLEDEAEQRAKLEVLQKHREEGTLTQKERKFLNKVIARNVRDFKSWDSQDDDLRDLQDAVLEYHHSHGSRAIGGKSKKKRGFVEESPASARTADHRYPGLTPGLAPVGLSDEEESDGE